jgi:hypothetical protein
VALVETQAVLKHIAVCVVYITVSALPSLGDTHRDAHHSHPGCKASDSSSELHPSLVPKAGGGGTHRAGCDPRFLLRLFHYLGAQSVCQVNSVSLAGYYVLN